MTTIDFVQADAVAWARDYTGEKFHALICDPPYHQKTAKNGKGILNTTWDSGDVAFQVATWKAFYNVLLDGAFVVAFASARGYHRLMVAIEDAGFDLMPSLFGWHYTSGFPKPSKPSLYLDKRAHAERPILATKKHSPKFDAVGYDYQEKHNGFNAPRETFNVTASATDEAKQFDGYGYGKQALKPAMEVIIIAQKPYATNNQLDGILEYGTGLMHLDALRVGDTPITINRYPSGMKPFGNGVGHAYESVTSTGYMPSHVYYEHHPDCNNHACDPCCATHHLNTDSMWDMWHSSVEQRIMDTIPFITHPKTQPFERDAGIVGEWHEISDGRSADCDRPFLRKDRKRLNPHPTPKPLGLAYILALLLKPPKPYGGRAFNPFGGSGGETIGLMLAEWDHVTMVELNQEQGKDYLATAQQRVAFWQSMAQQFNERNPKKLIPLVKRWHAQQSASQPDQYVLKIQEV